ncbi:hypothetical protein MO867_01455, partial [Microbulbifer sp. OS29]
IWPWFLPISPPKTVRSIVLFKVDNLHIKDEKITPRHLAVTPQQLKITMTTPLALKIVIAPLAGSGTFAFFLLKEEACMVVGIII